MSEKSTENKKCDKKKSEKDKKLYTDINYERVMHKYGLGKGSE